MVTNRQLKIDLLKSQNEYAQTIHKILAELSVLDPGAALLPIEKAVASRALVKQLWELLPEEKNCYAFEGVEEQTLTGRALLPATDALQPVTLHLGWDVLGFSCSLEAAWTGWKNFHTLTTTESFNCCIYPTHLEWYVVRAGYNLYPMRFTSSRYELVRQ